MNTFISLHTAVCITGLSKRTLWRRIADKTLRSDPGAGPGDQARVAVDDVFALSRFPLTADERDLVVAADSGTAESQCDLALFFLLKNLDQEAVYWLNKAARQDHLEAMYWLGRCAIAGRGLDADERVGMEWIGKAASHGHPIARRMMQFLYDQSRPAMEPSQLDAALENIERSMVLQVLNSSA